MPAGIEPVRTTEAAAPGAHYSQAVRSGDLVWTAGCVGVAPGTTSVVAGGIEAQVRQAILNVQAILRAAGTDLDHVVKTTCFVTSRSAFPDLDRAYRGFFASDPPARSTIVCDLVREEFLFEIEAVARIPS